MNAGPVGKTFRNYELLQELGRGAMGVVYRARQQTPSREVALKILFTKGEPAQTRARFRREIDALAALAGEPGILTIYEAGEQDGLLFFSMELVAGGSLDSAIEAGPWEAADTVELVAQLARTLHVAHEAGVVHRDIKPANVLLARDGRPMLSDFGLVKPLKGESLTASGAVVGTPRYLAPEQLDGDGVDRRIDIYALGALSFRMLSGSVPYGETSGLPQLYNRILTADPGPLPGVPSELERVVRWAMEKEPADRPSTALELAEALEAALEAPEAGPSLLPWVLAGVGVILVVVLVGVWSMTSPAPRSAEKPDPAQPPPDVRPDPDVHDPPPQKTEPRPQPVSLADAKRALGRIELDLKGGEPEFALTRWRRLPAGIQRHALLTGALPRRCAALATQWFQAGKNRAAAEACQLALRSDPSWRPSRSFLGLATEAGARGYNLNGGSTEFLQPQGLARQPTRLRPMYLKAVVHFELLVERCHDVARTTRSAVLLFAYANLACCYLNLRQDAKIPAVLDRAVALNPHVGHMWGWLTRGAYRLHTGDLVGARADLDRAGSVTAGIPPQQRKQVEALRQKLARLERR